MAQEEFMLWSCTRKNAQVVTSLQTSCYKYVHKLSSHCLFPVVVTGPCQPVSGWGVYSKIWAPFHSRAPWKKFSGNHKFFSKIWRRGGGVDVMFPKTKVPKIFRNTTFPRKFSAQILHFLQILQFHPKAPSHDKQKCYKVDDTRL
jgi:hypothetical protein